VIRSCSMGSVGFFEDAGAAVSVVDPNGNDGDDDQNDGENDPGGVKEVENSVQIALEGVSGGGAVGRGDQCQGDDSGFQRDGGGDHV
jgi:hypothetical protein